MCALKFYVGGLEVMCISVNRITQKLRVDCPDMSGIDKLWIREELIKFWKVIFIVMVMVWVRVRVSAHAARHDNALYPVPSSNRTQ